jgi:hypothetical protein
MFKMIFFLFQKNIKKYNLSKHIIHRFGETQTNNVI